jgi:hypothetical protein
MQTLTLRSQSNRQRQSHLVLQKLLGALCTGRCQIFRSSRRKIWWRCRIFSPQTEAGGRKPGPGGFSALAKGDVIDFELSADPRGVFGEKNVMAVNVRGGTVDAVEGANAKVAELEKERLTDRLVFEKLEKELLQDRIASRSALKQLHGKIRNLEAEVEACKHYAVKIGGLERKIEMIEKSMSKQVTESVRLGMASLVEDCHRGVFDEVRAKGSSRLENFSEFQDPFSESEGSESASGSTRGGRRARTKRKQRGKMITSNQGPGVFGMLRKSFGLGLLMTLFLFLAQIALFSGSSCDALVVAVEKHEPLSPCDECEAIEMVYESEGDGLRGPGGVDVDYEDGFEENGLPSKYENMLSAGPRIGTDAFVI